MLRLPLLLLLTVSALPGPVQSAPVTPSWTYEDQDDWEEEFPLCGGPRQSPVRLKPAGTHPWGAGGRPTLLFEPNLENGRLTATNTGRTLKLQLLSATGKPLVQLRGKSPGPLSGVYTLDNLHLHWNDQSGGRGSEHQMHGRFEEAEAHFVFFNQAYGDVKEALNHPDGLAVVGLLLRPRYYHWNWKHDLALPSLVLRSELAQLAAVGNSLSRPANLASLRPLLNRALRRVFSYAGSLTTPPCSPAVTWLVADRPATIEPRFLRALRTSLYDGNTAKKQKIQNNWRELQPLGNRIIYRYKH